MKSIYSFSKHVNQSKLLKTLLSFVFTVCLATTQQAQIISIGSNDQQNEYSPISTYYNHSYTQTIYLGSELSAAGGNGPSYINSVSFYYASVGTPISAWNSWDIFMGNSIKSSFGTSTSWETGLSSVFSGTINIPAFAGQWITIPLTTPFLWDGSSNLIIGIHENLPTYAYPQAKWGHTSSTSVRTLVFYDDVIDPDPLSPPSSNYSHNSYADAQFDLTALAACSGSVASGSAISTNTTACVNIPFNLALSGGTLASNLTYQWQSSPDGTTWSNLGTSQNAWLYSISSQTVTSLYRCITTCPLSSSSATSTPITVTQNSPLNCFCTPDFLDCTYGNNFSAINFSNITNYDPSCSPGSNSYQDLTGLVTASLTAGQNYSFSASNAQSGQAMVGAWIDYNKNGVFENAEYTLIGNGISSGTFTATIAVPFTAQNGLMRMRLKLEDGTNSQNACTTGSYYGQTLDFLIDMTGLSTCSGSPVAGSATSTSVSVCPNTPYTLDLTGTTLASSMIFQWQSSSNGTTWANLGSVQDYVPYTVLNQSSMTYYRCVVTCTASAASSTSTPVTVNQNAFNLCYCSPGSTSCGQSSFTDFSFSGIASTGITCGGSGYEDFTIAVPSATVTYGQTYTLSTTFSSPYSENVLGAWIDYDHNSVFDTYEYISIGSGASGTLTAAVLIPYTAVGGITTMRVKLESADNSSVSLNPCYANQYDGHTLDYAVFINAAPACSGTPNAGSTTANVSNACPTTEITLNLSGNDAVSGATYQWQYSTNGTTWLNLGSVQSHVTYSLTNQMSTTFYRCVVTCPASTSSQTATAISIIQNIPTACYCIPDPMDCSTEGMITQVVLGTMSYTSGCGINGYNDFTSSVSAATLTAGQSYTTDVTLGADYGGNVNIWIDYNQNGVFDPSEYTFLGSSASSYTISGGISVPLSAMPGTTRMRVRNISFNDLGASDACISPSSPPGKLSVASIYIPSGETEDYSLVISAADCSGNSIPANLITSSSSGTVCSGSALTLTVSGVPYYTGLTYQFKESPTGSTYTNVSSAVSNASITLNPVQSNYYLCDILCHGISAATTSSVFVTVTASSLSATASSYTVCPAESVTLTASGATSYTWTNNGAHTATTVVTPTVGTTYTVSGLESSGCVVTHTVLIFVKPATSISGTVTTGGSTPVSGTVILYKYEPFYTKFDSISLQNLASDGSYTFPSINYGIYIVKAVPVTNTLQVTYGSSSVNWKTATTLLHQCAITDIQNIDVIPLTILSAGPGLLTGQITEGQKYGKKPNGTLSPGQPIGGIVVKGGKNPGGNMFAQTTTDLNGNYTLSGLPDNLTGESYFILVDIPGLDTNNTYHRVITPVNNIYTHLDFVVDSAKINPISQVSVHELEGLVLGIKVYPNPASNQVTIAYQLVESAFVSIEIHDVLGKMVKTILPETKQDKNDHVFIAPLSNLTTGIYFLKLKINHVETTTKLFITD